MNTFLVTQKINDSPYNEPSELPKTEFNLYGEAIHKSIDLINKNDRKVEIYELIKGNKSLAKYRHITDVTSSKKGEVKFSQIMSENAKILTVMGPYIMP